jgi:hypothetical protein
MVDSLPDGEDLGGLADDGWVGTADRLLVPSPSGLLTWEGPSRPAYQGTTPFRRVRGARPARRPAEASGMLGRAGWWGPNRATTTVPRARHTFMVWAAQ